LPPYWETWWFYLFCFLTLSLFLYYFYRLRIKQLNKRAKIENDYTKRIAELELNALQSQMNPHFIFNALGAIQYYQSENAELAEQYLGKFARLMRLFLESSKKKFTTLKEEKRTY
jgi:sensor histidine kinase YesM